MFYVPVVDSNQKPLMPTTPNRARSWIRSGKATPFWKRGVFCVRLNVKPSGRKKQSIACGIDPGSKREAFTVVTEKKVLLNVLSDAVTHVGDRIKTRRDMRRSRRTRNTPYRQPRFKNRSRKSFLPPSTRARWNLKLRIVTWLKRLYPIKIFVVEDVAAKPRKGARQWNVNFSPIEVGKKYFYESLSSLGKVVIRKGFETKALRDEAGLKKSRSKLSERFDAHNVDSFVLARSGLKVSINKPNNTKLLRISPIEVHRRQLHILQPTSGGVRKSYGGTRSLGFTRGSLVVNKKYGLMYVGGYDRILLRISLHDIRTGKRISKSGKVQESKFLTYASWRSWYSTVPLK